MENRRITLVRPSQIFDSFMDEFFGNTGVNTFMKNTVDVDMFETDSEVVVKAKAPGFKEDDVKITIEDTILTIEGNMKKEEDLSDVAPEKSGKQEDKKYHIKEMHEKSFIRSLSLPTRVDADRSEANFENGIITIKMPKVEEVKPKTISVKIKK